MRKLFIAGALVSTALASPALARDGAPYVGIDAGVLVPDDLKLDFNNGTTRVNDGVVIKHKLGYDVDGVFGSEPGFLRGSAGQWAEQLAELVVNERITAFFLYRVNDPDVLRRFAAEVAPAVRDLVA